jgi:hypothetical protein
LTQDFDLFLHHLDASAGTLRVGLARTAGPISGGRGSVLEIVFRIRSDAPAGRALINLRQNLGVLTTQLNEGGLDLNPDPSNEAGDVLDGIILVGKRAQMLARDLVFAAEWDQARQRRRGSARR